VFICWLLNCTGWPMNRSTPDSVRAQSLIGSLLAGMIDKGQRSFPPSRTAPAPTSPTRPALHEAASLADSPLTPPRLVLVAGERREVLVRGIDLHPLTSLNGLRVHDDGRCPGLFMVVGIIGE
jgi:hypothetical protein